MFNGLSGSYSLVNVVAEQLKVLLNAGIAIKLLVSEDCPEENRPGIFADARIEWVKITNRLDGKRIVWHDYAQPDGQLHESFFAEADVITADLTQKLEDVNLEVKANYVLTVRHTSCGTPAFWMQITFSSCSAFSHDSGFINVTGYTSNLAMCCGQNR